MSALFYKQQSDACARLPPTCCPCSCLNPLLRSRDRRVYCAGCQLYVVREGEEQLGGEAPQQQQQQEGQGAPTPAAEAEQAAAQAAQGGLVRDMQAAAFHAPASGTAQLQLSGVPALQQHLPAVDAAATAVAARLAAAAADLASVAPTAALRLLAEVQQCAAALQALADCRRSMAGGP